MLSNITFHNRIPTGPGKNVYHGKFDTCNVLPVASVFSIASQIFTGIKTFTVIKVCNIIYNMSNYVDT